MEATFNGPWFLLVSFGLVFFSGILIGYMIATEK